MTNEVLALRSETLKRRLRWGVPVVVAGAVTAGVVIATASPSGAAPTLPKRTVAQLLTAVQTKAAQNFSGVVRERANLGLPSLPGAPSSASLSWQTFVTGSRSAKVWVAGPTKQRIALQGELSEADVIHKGRDVWTYTSDSNSVTHATLPAGTGTRAPDASHAYNPAQVARDLLRRIGSSTSVTADASRYVAGRAAYILVLRPRDSNSTVRRITVAIDAKKFVPLQLQVFGTGSSAAFSLGFTSISYSTPAASTFDFHTPAGATVSSDPIGVHGDSRHHSVRRVRAHGGTSAPTPAAPRRSNAATSDIQPNLLGSGWTAVAVLPTGSITGGSGSLSNLGGLLHDATTSLGSNGDRLLHTALVNAVLRPDGKAFIGAVQPAYLEHVAATAR